MNPLSLITTAGRAVASLPSGIADMIRAGRRDPTAQLVLATAKADLKRARVRKDVVHDLEALRDARARLLTRADNALTRRGRDRAANLVASADATIADLEQLLARMDRDEDLLVTALREEQEEEPPTVFKPADEPGGGR